MKDDVTYRSLLVDSPAQTGLFVLGPILIACVQLLNSYVHDLPWLASVPFSVAMVAYAVLYTRHRLANRRRRELESDALAAAGD